MDPALAEASAQQLTSASLSSYGALPNPQAVYEAINTGSTQTLSSALQEGNPLGKQLGIAVTSNLAFSIDRASGKNGEKAYVTVTMKTDPANNPVSTGMPTPPPYIVIKSTLGPVTRAMPILVNTQ